MPGIFQQNRGSEDAMPITSLNHYLIVSKNLERSKAFYEKVLGMELADRPDFGFPGYWLKTGDAICVHLASQDPNKIRDQFLLKKHPTGTNGSGSVDHIAFLAKDANQVRIRIQQSDVEMHFRSFPDAKPPLFQIFLKDPDDVTIELNFLGERIKEDDWKGQGSASAMTLRKSAGKQTEIAKN
jgi:catechol 2,3-dioxygenase-like lactoylglutathione lyase family enzyme